MPGESWNTVDFESEAAAHRPSSSLHARLLGFAVVLLAILALPSTAAAAPPPNDNFADAEVLTGVEDSASGSNVEATPEVGEPEHAGKEGGVSVWYSWTPSQNGTAEVNTCESSAGLDTLLAVYTASGAVPPFSNLAEVAGSDDSDVCGGFSLASRVSFDASAGTTYYIAVDGYLGDTGALVVELFEDVPTNDDLADAKVLSGTSAETYGSTFSATKESGEPSHAGNAGGASVWYSWIAPQAGSVTLTTCFGPDYTHFDTLLAVYTEGGAVPPFSNLVPVASNNDGAGCQGGQSKLSFKATPLQIYYFAVDGFGGASGGFLLGLEQDLEPPTFSGTNPASPADQNAPRIQGNAEAGSTVQLYTTPSCSGPIAGFGSAAEFESSGIGVHVGDNSTTTFYGILQNSSETSSCSADSVTYVELTPTQPPPPGGGGPGGSGPRTPGPGSVGAVVARVQGARLAIKKGIKMLATCVAACKVTAKLQASGRPSQARRSRRGSATIGRAAGSLAGPGDMLLTVRLTGSGKRMLRQAARTGADLTVRIVDQVTGSARSLTRPIVITRKAPKNRPPEFHDVPSDRREGNVIHHEMTVTENFEYDSVGRLKGSSTDVRITIVSPATDPDGDPLTYTWKAPQGSIVGNAYGAVWTDADGSATVTVSDGRGGSDTFTYR